MKDDYSSLSELSSEDIEKVVEICLRELVRRKVSDRIGRIIEEDINRDAVLGELKRRKKIT